MSDPIARSPIAPVSPVEVRDGWEVSARRSTASLVLADETPLAKVSVRAPEDGPTARALDVPHGRARRDDDGLLIGAGPGEWLTIAAVGTARRTADRLSRLADGSEHVSVVDVTHGRALMRLTGPAAPELLARVCAIDLADDATPDGTAFRTSIASLVTDVVRDDRRGTPSYVLHCERSSGQYLFDALLDAGGDLDVDATGFEPTPKETR